MWEQGVRGNTFALAWRSNFGHRTEGERSLISYKILVTCTLIVRLHKHIICFDLDMYFLIDCNMSITVVAISKHMHLVKFYYFAVTTFIYKYLLKKYINLNLIEFLYFFIFNFIKFYK